uniref:Auxin-responsive protein n=1 Tax=Carya cathayensis TaxID=139927 RepID=A0A2R3XZ58_9ROSI|nr:Aux/IAA28 [Carya cathayensis]
MDGSSRNDVCPQFLDLVPKERAWLVNRYEQRRRGLSEENKLELRLGPPGEDWSMTDNKMKDQRERSESLISLGYYSTTTSMTQNTSINNNGNGSQTQIFSSPENPGGAVLSSPWPSSAFQGKTQHNQKQTKAPSFLQVPSTLQSLPVLAQEASQPRCSNVVELQSAEKKAFSQSSAMTAVPNSSQKRTAPSPVVGWPPIRSFRKNLASSSSSKPASESQNAVPDKVPCKKPVESCTKGLFVKINMDGVPIGRKVDLKAYDSYENLSSAVDELFRGLLAAQRDSREDGIQKKQEEDKAITGLLVGSGEYTLVYEDNEGDRMLVGDVPWHMFVSTVKRLRVLKSSELSTLSLGSSKQDKVSSLESPRR